MTSIQQLKKKSIEHITKADIQQLLTLAGDEQQELFQWAREVRHENQVDRVLLRGVIEISNYCQKNCDYCAMRASSKDLRRYTLTADEILSIAAAIKASGISVIFLQGGQNPDNDHLLDEVIPIIKNDMMMEVLLCLGERSLLVYEKFFGLGADSYILKFETSEPNLYRKFAHTPLARRLEYIKWIQASGMKIGTGNIIGLPDQTIADIAEDMLLGINMKPDFISSSPFIPSVNTPLQNHSHGSAEITLNAIAIWRIALKTPLIPAVSALETVYKDGQTMGLLAGANVLTVNFTPKGNQELYKIYSESRFVVSLEHALRSIENAGLSVAG